MKKIYFIIPKCSKEKITKIIECFDNISYRFFNEDVKFEIFSDNLEQDIFFLNNLYKDIHYTLEKVKKIKWTKEIQKNDINAETSLFIFHQGLRKISTTKNKIIIPASSAFGTGSHESTILIIKRLQFVAFNLSRIEISCYGLIPKTFSPCSVISRPLVSTSSDTLNPIVAFKIPRTIAVVTAAQAT